MRIIFVVDHAFGPCPVCDNLTVGYMSEVDSERTWAQCAVCQVRTGDFATFGAAVKAWEGRLIHFSDHPVGQQIEWMTKLRQIREKTG